MKLGLLEPARANSAIYAISTWLGSRKWAQEFERKKLEDDLLKRLETLQQNYAAVAEILASRGIALPSPRWKDLSTSSSDGRSDG